MRNLLSLGMVVVLAALTPSGAAAQERDSGKTRFCLIIPPEVKAAANTPPQTPLARPVTEKAGEGHKKMSFYSGEVEKVGLGAPDCFQVGSREKKKSFAGADMIYRDLNGYVEALNGELEIRPFFPSVGYFNRTSKEGAGVALGVGVKGPVEELRFEEETQNPSAGVFLMFGIGF